MHRPWIEHAADGVELLAVAIIVVTIVGASVRGVVRALREPGEAVYTLYRQRVGKAMLLGLEVLVAADIIRTVLLEPSVRNVLVLGLLVLIRILLSWSLTLEIEKRWPWQRADGA